MTTCDVIPGPAIVTVPFKAFAFNPVVFTETVSVPDALPEPGVTESHDPPKVVAAVAVKLAFDELLMVIVCDAGCELLPI